MHARLHPVESSAPVGIGEPQLLAVQRHQHVGHSAPVAGPHDPDHDPARVAAAVPFFEPLESLGLELVGSAVVDVGGAAVAGSGYVEVAAVTRAWRDGESKGALLNRDASSGIVPRRPEPEGPGHARPPPGQRPCEA